MYRNIFVLYWFLMAYKIQYLQTTKLTKGSNKLKKIVYH